MNDTERSCFAHSVFWSSFIVAVAVALVTN